MTKSSAAPLSSDLRIKRRLSVLAGRQLAVAHERAAAASAKLGEAKATGNPERAILEERRRDSAVARSEVTKRYAEVINLCASPNGALVRAWFVARTSAQALAEEEQKKEKASTSSVSRDETLDPVACIDELAYFLVTSVDTERHSSSPIARIQYLLRVQSRAQDLIAALSELPEVKWPLAPAFLNRPSGLAPSTRFRPVESDQSIAAFLKNLADVADQRAQYLKQWAQDQAAEEASGRAARGARIVESPRSVRRDASGRSGLAIALIGLDWLARRFYVTDPDASALEVIVFMVNASVPSATGRITVGELKEAIRHRPPRKRSATLDASIQPRGGSADTQTTGGGRQSPLDQFVGFASAAQQQVKKRRKPRSGG
ncbi:MAG: hypothetical protein U1F56_01820 [Rubrivivax sp.]